MRRPSGEVDGLQVPESVVGVPRDSRIAFSLEAPAPQAPIVAVLNGQISKRPARTGGCFRARTSSTIVCFSCFRMAKFTETNGLRHEPPISKSTFQIFVHFLVRSWHGSAGGFVTLARSFIVNYALYLTIVFADLDMSDTAFAT
jgi:hypothetical protein